MRRVLFVGLMGQFLVVSGCYGTATCLRGTLTDYQGAIELRSDSSAVRSALPVTAQGKVSRHKISGTIGSGPGNLRPSAQHGSVRLR